MSKCVPRTHSRESTHLGYFLVQNEKVLGSHEYYHDKGIFSVFFYPSLAAYLCGILQTPSFLISVQSPSATQLMMFFLLYYLFSSVVKPAKVCDLCHFCLQAINSPCLKTILSLSTESFEFLRGNKLRTCQLRDFLSSRVSMFHLLPVTSFWCLHMQLNFQNLEKFSAVLERTLVAIFLLTPVSFFLYVSLYVLLLTHYLSSSTHMYVTPLFVHMCTYSHIYIYNLSHCFFVYYIYDDMYNYIYKFYTLGSKL